MATDQCQGRINRDACFGFVSSRFFLSMNALNPLGRQGTEVRALFLFHFFEEQDGGKIERQGSRVVFRSLSEVMIQIEPDAQSSPTWTLRLLPSGGCVDN